jgi:hypothetical protein
MLPLVHVIEVKHELTWYEDVALPQLMLLRTSAVQASGGGGKAPTESTACTTRIRRGHKEAMHNG